MRFPLVTVRRQGRQGDRAASRGQAGRRSRRARQSLGLETLEGRRVLAACYIYGIDNSNMLYEINPDPTVKTVTPVFQAESPVTGNSNAFAYDRTNASREFLFFMNGGGSGESTLASVQTLYAWNKLTNQQTQVATAFQLGLSSSSTYQPANAAFYSDAYWFFEEGTATLHKISLDYRSGTPVFGAATAYSLSGLINGSNNFPTNTNRFGDITIDRANGILYASNTNGAFYSVDISDAAVNAGDPKDYKALGQLGDGTYGLQLSFNSDYSTLYGQRFIGSDGSGVWYEIQSFNSSPALSSVLWTSDAGKGFRDLGGASPVRSGEADLTITKDDGKSTVFAGDGVTYIYTITVTNNGPDAAELVSVGDTWPTGFTQVELLASAGTVGTPDADGNFTWSVGTLDSSATATLTVSYTVPFGIAAGGYTNTAVVSSSTYDPDSDNNTATDTNFVVSNALVAGTDLSCDSTPRVYVINPYSGAVVSSFLAYEAGFRGGVRVAVGDVDDDGVLDVVTAPGPGRRGEVNVFNLDGTKKTGFSQPYLPFGGSYRQGVEISLGQVNDDGNTDLVASKSRGRGDVQVAMSNGTAFTPYKSFTAFRTPYTGGATAAVSGAYQIVVGSGLGMTPTVKTYDISGTPRVISQFNPIFAPGTHAITASAQRFQNAGDQLAVLVAAGRFGKGKATAYQAVTNTSYKTFSYATRYRNAPVSAAASALAESLTVDTVFMAQGIGGKDTIKKLDATTGLVDATFVPTYLGKALTAPLRIATNTRPNAVVK